MISLIHDWFSILFLWPGTSVWARHLWLAGTNWTFFRGLFLFMFSSGFGVLPYNTLIEEVWKYELYYSSRDTIHPKETSDSCAVRITYIIRWKRGTCISVICYTIPYVKDNMAWFWLWCLTPLPTILHLYRGGQFSWWRKPE